MDIRTLAGMHYGQLTCTNKLTTDYITLYMYEHNINYVLYYYAHDMHECTMHANNFDLFG